MTQLRLTSFSSKTCLRAVGLLVAGAGLTAATCLLTSLKAVAQDVPPGPDPLDENNSRYSDPFSSRDDNQYTPFFDMMHRMQLGTIRSISEFDQDQQQNIGSEASDFRSRQKERLQQQGQANPSVTSSPTGNRSTSNQ